MTFKELKDFVEMIPEEVICRHALDRLAVEAYKVTDDDYGEEEAIEWASGFEFPADLGAKDGNLLREAGSELEACPDVRPRFTTIAQECGWNGAVG